MIVKELTIDRYDDLLAIWQRTSGISLRDADSRPATERYLQRNPGLSFIAEIDGRIIGCAMCGHDGRRGYLQHVVVDPAYRNRGIAQNLVSRCLAALEREGIFKTHLDVFAANTTAQEYWTKCGWIRRDDIYRYSITQNRTPNA